MTFVTFTAKGESPAAWAWGFRSPRWVEAAADELIVLVVVGCLPVCVGCEFGMRMVVHTRLGIVGVRVVDGLVRRIVSVLVIMHVLVRMAMRMTVRSTPS